MGMLHGTRRALLKGRRTYSEKVLSYAPIAYWPLWEATGTTAQCLVNSAQNGTYTGVTLANALGPDGSRCPFFDGANDYVDIYSATYASAFNGGEGTAAIWARVFNVGVWTDAAYRFTFENYATGFNYINILKWNTNNQMTWRYIASATLETVNLTPFSSVDWFHVAITWSAGADEVRAFINGVQTGATQTGLGVWAGALDPARTLIGAAQQAPVFPWHGWLAHYAVFPLLSPAAILDLATV